MGEGSPGQDPTAARTVLDEESGGSGENQQRPCHRLKRERHSMIAEVLSTGAENATPGRELCALLDLTSRELTQRVENERRAGAPICASVRPPYGYFLAATQQEMRAYCHSLRHRAGEVFKTRSICLQTIEGLPEGE